MRSLIHGIFRSGGAYEIAKCMADYIRSRNATAITLNSRVTSIALENNSGIKVTTNGTHDHHFSHVISTIPQPVLRTIDLSKAELSTMQANALRELNYGPSVKIGLQFKTAWWTTGVDLASKPLNIVEGQTYTDRPLHTIVYPLFGNVQAGKTTTLIASYCWTEDATRLGALIDKDDKTLLALVLKELADIHNVSVDFLHGELVENGYKAWSWSHNPYSMGKQFIVFLICIALISVISPHLLKAPLRSSVPANSEVYTPALTAPPPKGFSILPVKPSACGTHGWRAHWTARGRPFMRSSFSPPSDRTEESSLRIGA